MNRLLRYELRAGAPFLIGASLALLIALLPWFLMPYSEFTPKSQVGLIVVMLISGPIGAMTMAGRRRPLIDTWERGLPVHAIDRWRAKRDATLINLSVFTFIILALLALYPHIGLGQMGFLDVLGYLPCLFAGGLAAFATTLSPSSRFANVEGLWGSLVAFFILAIGEVIREYLPLPGWPVSLAISIWVIRISLVRSKLDAPHRL